MELWTPCKHVLEKNFTGLRTILVFTTLPTLFGKFALFLLPEAIFVNPWNSVGETNFSALYRSGKYS